MIKLTIRPRYHQLNSCSEQTLGDFVRELASAARVHNKKFLVMRNYQKLPDENVAGDIDVMISRNAIAKWRDIIGNVCNRFNLAHRTGPVFIYVSVEFISCVNNNELQIDIEPRMNWRGVDWISNDECIERSRLFKENIWILHPADECVISFCMSYLYGGFVKEKYLPLMSEQAESNKEEVIRLMTNIFGKKIANKIVVSLIERDISEISQKATEYRIRVLIKGFLQHPLHFAYTFLLGYYLELKNKVLGAKNQL